MDVTGGVDAGCVVALGMLTDFGAGLAAGERLGLAADADE